MQNILWVALGSAIGGVFRYGVIDHTLHYFGFSFPWGTLAVNVTGSFAIGIIAALAAPESRYVVSSAGRFFLMAGICGGFTTFSFLSWQILALLQLGMWMACVFYIAATILLGLAGAWGGFRLGERLGRKRPPSRIFES